jgi:hypothetical protein
MQERLAFTAGVWGRAAVVCRAVENRADPLADQQLGSFNKDRSIFPETGVTPRRPGGRMSQVGIEDRRVGGIHA